MHICASLSRSNSSQDPGKTFAHFWRDNRVQSNQPLSRANTNFLKAAGAEGNGHPVSILSPGDDDRRAYRIATAFSSVNCQPPLKPGVIRNGATKPKQVRGAVIDNLLQTGAFSESMDQVAVSAKTASQVCQDAAGVGGMVAQHALIESDIVQGKA